MKFISMIVDEEVHAKIAEMKQPSKRRAGEKESGNDVLRRVLKL